MLRFTGNTGLRAGVHDTDTTAAAASARVSAFTPALRRSGLRTGASWLWLLLVVAALAYGSLIPFDFRGTAFQASNGFGLSKLQFRATTREDVVTNVLVYFPLGAAFVLCGRRRRRSLAGMAVIVGAVLSLCLETLQTGIALRVASLTDVALNTLGTVLGVIGGLALRGTMRPARRRFERGFRDRPWTTLARVLTVALMVYGLVPFDFIPDSAALHDSFLRARWDLAGVSFHPAGGRPIPFADPPFQPWVAQLSAAAWFSALAFLSARARRSAGRARLLSWVGAVRHSLIVAGVIEIMQLFTLSHRFDLATIVIRGLAGVLGASWAVLAADRADPARSHPRLTSSTLIFVGLAVLQILAIQIATLNPSLVSFQPVQAAAVRWMPFEALWHRPMVNAASDVLANLVTFAVLALTIILALDRMHFRFAWFWTAVGVTLVAASVEALRLCTLSRMADTTGPVLALVAVAIAWPFSRLLEPLPKRASIRS